MSLIAIYLMKTYQLSKNLFHKRVNHCKYIPSCSEYSIESFSKKGFFKGLLLSFKRVLKCNPLSRGGYDGVK